MKRCKYLLLAVGLVTIALSTGCSSIIVDEFPICTDSAGQGSPVISGNIVVWSDGRYEGYASIYGYDLDTKTEFLICTVEKTQRIISTIRNINIKGNIVTWQQLTDDGKNYYTWKYNLETAIKSQVNDDEVNQSYSIEGEQAFPIPTIKDWNPVDRDGDVVLFFDYSPTSSLWREGRAGDLVVYNLEKQEAFRLPETWTQINVARIKGNYVIWVEDIYDNPNIFGYDLVTHKGFTICNKNGQQLNPDIDGNVVVWQDNRNQQESKSDIYGARILRRSR